LEALANDPSTLRRTWESVKQVMAPGALDPLVKELIYLAVSASMAAAIASLAWRCRKAAGHDRKCSGNCWRSSVWPTKPTV